jgi:hypothetical protein
MHEWSPVQVSAVDAEALAHHALAARHRRLHLRLDPALPIELAFRLRDQHLRALLLRGERLAQGVAHAGDVVGAADRAHPVDADAAHRLLDRMAVLRVGCADFDDSRSWPPVAEV